MMMSSDVIVHLEYRQEQITVNIFRKSCLQSDAQTDEQISRNHSSLSIILLYCDMLMVQLSLAVETGDKLPQLKHH